MIDEATALAAFRKAEAHFQMAIKYYKLDGALMHGLCIADHTMGPMYAATTRITFYHAIRNV